MTLQCIECNFPTSLIGTRLSNGNNLAFYSGVGEVFLNRKILDKSFGGRRITQYGNGSNKKKLSQKKNDKDIDSLKAN